MGESLYTVYVTVGLVLFLTRESEDAGIEPRTVATLALTARRSNHLARSYPPLG